MQRLTRGEPKRKRKVSAPRAGRRVEVGRLVRDPAEEARKTGMGAQHTAVAAGPGEFDIAELRVDGAVADGMDWHRVPATPAFRHGMVPFGSSPERTGAEPAMVHAIRHAQDWAQVAPTHLPAVFAFMRMSMPPGAPVIFMSICIS